MTLPDLEPLTRFDERLRQVPTDEAALEDAFAQARAALAGTDDLTERLHLLTYAGTAARVLGRGDESIDLLHEALDLATGDPAIAARIRLGEAYRCADRPDKALRELEPALADARRSGTYLDFALQHLGKALVDAGRPAGAVPLLEEALELRLERGDAQLIESTELALTRARDHG